MKKLIAVTVLIALSGCATTSQTDTVVIGGVEYVKGHDGSVTLSKEEYAKVSQIRNPALLKRTSNTLNLSPEEYEILSKNGEALFSLAGMANEDEPVSALIRRGSLKNNIERLLAENGWRNLYFEGEDYFVEKSHIIESEAVETAVIEVLEDKPMYVCFDSEDSSVTAIKADVNAMLLDYELKQAEKLMSDSASQQQENQEIPTAETVSLETVTPG